ncbi:MAG TPA: hypothetical protein VGO33_02835 [Gemmatimonadaceae bacterium]|jgi:hypothetical protein|nr:hypothetical protein [Gemmatimonadaceae bacterium]
MREASDIIFSLFVLQQLEWNAEVELRREYFKASPSSVFAEPDPSAVAALVDSPILKVR